MILLKKKRSTAGTVVRRVKDAVTSHPKAVAAAGIAAATAVGAAVMLRKRASGVTDATTFHVESDANGAWLLRKDGSDEPMQRHASKREAISAAREYAREHNPSVLAIHREDGKVARRHSYDDR
ncbi:MAG: DUF2188 domain-containing protein [Longimicrobiales bacterium]